MTEQNNQSEVNERIEIIRQALREEGVPTNGAGVYIDGNDYWRIEQMGAIYLIPMQQAVLHPLTNRSKWMPLIEKYGIR